MSRRWLWVYIGFFMGLAMAPTSEAKVIFTGYADLRMTAASQTKLRGGQPVLALFGLSDRQIDARGFTADAVGLFASTSFREHFSFNADITYRTLRFNATELRVQYGFLEYAPRDDMNFRVGKVTLPFGYYNENRFYSFQREEISAPAFQSGILGLPISDFGIVARKSFRPEAFDLNLALYAVNGYGNVAGNQNSLRIPAAVGLAMAQNLGAANSNEEVSLGGQVEFANILDHDLRFGVSGYTGAWDPRSQKNLNMANIHAGWKWKRLDLSAEGLMIDANGDQGFFGAVGNTDWRTRGFFVRGVYHLADPWDMPVYFHSRYEETRTEGDGVGFAREYLRSMNGGVSIRVNDNLIVKSEFAKLYYELPVISTGLLGLDARSATMSAAVSF